MGSRRTLLLAGAALLGSLALAEEPALDPYSGFKMAGDWEIVRANCIACHSPKLVTQQRGTEAQWLNIIRWMQATQNLAQFDPETERKIVTYLAEYYPPEKDRRRAPIPPDLMPPNPYSTVTNQAQ
ncbi:MAG: hypothetical protein OEW35_17025 [Gammaproteobacteria bacterium]|nr:hypothetical protein [Gammaproteobacteria bacterium]MDH5311549.1 hypothetical protein [Gammaproteobacteria bacterium]